jgi:hypothetical protein
MTRLKLTSPGVLLILAIVATGGIFLLDMHSLSPYIEAEKWRALREEAGRTEHGIRLARLGQQPRSRRLLSTARLPQPR